MFFRKVVPWGIPARRTGTLLYLTHMPVQWYPLVMNSQSSRLRQRLAEVGKQHQRQIELLLEERGALIRGSFGTRARVCGNPGCKCARGELHESKYLSASEDGRTRQVHVPAGEELEVAQGVARYRRFWEGRRRVAELVQLQLELVDQLGQSLLEPYPPDNPLPPAAHRGRVRKGKGHRS